MEIVKSLNLNKTPQAVENNSIIFAKNIKLSNDEQYLTNEESLLNAVSVINENEKIVGVIPTNKELVVFKYNSSTQKSSIIRVKETDNGFEEVEVNSGWKYSQGTIKGTYTYNVEGDLIVAISEYNTDVDVPLKILNLDTTSPNDDENIYTIAPNIPFATCSYEYYQGITIPNGIYQFFIRYKFNDNKYSKWFPLSCHIRVYNNKYTTLVNHTFKTVLNTHRQVAISSNINDDDLDSNVSFKLNINLNNEVNNISEFQLGYTLQHNNSTVARIWNSFIYNKNTNILFDAANIKEANIDDFYENSFNIYNSKCIETYGNRLYVANYKELNGNLNFNNIVNNISATYELESTQEASSGIIKNTTLFPNQVYNFFIHFVRSDGSYTNGIRINNNSNNTMTAPGLSVSVNMKDKLSSIDYSSVADEGLKAVYEKYKNYRFCDIFNNSTSSNFGYYENLKGEIMFKAPLIDKDYRIKPVFNGITLPVGYVGYFISYENVEKNSYFMPLATSVYVFNHRCKSLDVEFGFEKLNGELWQGIAKYKISEYGFLSKISDDKSKIELINSYDNNIIYSDSPANDSANSMGYINLSFQEYILDSEFNAFNQIINQTNEDYYTHVGVVYSPIQNLYSNTNKILIKLGGIKYGSAGNYSESTVGDFDLPSYCVKEPILLTKTNDIKDSQYGYIITEDGFVEYNDGVQYQNNYMCLLSFYKYSNIDMNAINIKNGIDTLVQTLNTDNKRRINTIIYPKYLSDLFELKGHYIRQNNKTYINYQETLVNIENYTKFIRRSDVIGDESNEIAWRNFSANNYKVISENKGDITNLVGIGLYLLVHTEHSLFMFNRDATMKTQDKDVQLYIPDAFDTSYQEVFTSDKGYGGLQDANAWCINEHGYTFFDNDSKQLYNFDNGKLNIISKDICKFIESIKLNQTRIAFDSFNNRVLICFKTKDNKYVTISYNTLSKTFISLHDYKFDLGWNTKNNVYLAITNGNNIWTFKDSNTIGKYEELQIDDSSIFPSYHSDRGDISYSVIDIIFNLEYETIKSLECIDYVLKEILEYVSYYNQAEENSNRRYSGYQLRLYSDSCNSRLLDINVENMPNKFNDYKYPWYDKGRWNLNYFRNYIEREEADSQSLIYGKYLVASFIFNNDSQKRIKLENINFNVRRY